MSTRSGWWFDSQKRELPQYRQNERVPCSEDRWTTRSSCPVSIASCSRGTPNQVTKATPWLRWHIVQWQWPQKRLGSSTRTSTRPQRHEPETVWDEVIESLPYAVGRAPMQLKPGEAPADFLARLHESPQSPPSHEHADGDEFVSDRNDGSFWRARHDSNVRPSGPQTVERVRSNASLRLPHCEHRQGAELHGTEHGPTALYGPSTNLCKQGVPVAPRASHRAQLGSPELAPSRDAAAGSFRTIASPPRDPHPTPHTAVG